MKTGMALLLSVLAACAADPEPLMDDDLADTEGDTGAGGEECVAFDSYTCRDGNVYAMDSCGEVQDLMAECTGDSFCEVGLAGCCTATPTSGPSLLDIDAYVIGTTVNLSAPTDALSWEMEIVSAPADTDPQYMMVVMDFYVGSHRIWIAMGTDLNAAANSPHGFYMTDLTSADVAVRLAEPDGYQESDETSNRGIRKPYPWQPGRFVLALERGEATATGHWFELSVQAEGDEAPTFLGAIDIPNNGGAPATIAANHTEYMYIYSGRADYSEIERLATHIKPVANQATVNSVTTNYRPFEASEARWQDGRLFMSVGKGTTRCTPDGLQYMADPNQ